MNWDNLFEATNAVDKPVPGWLFKEICDDVQHYPEYVPDVAEHCMRCVISQQRMVSLKGCLTLRHLAEEVPDFQNYLKRCPEALEHLAQRAKPPMLPQARSLERDDDKIYRMAADRALRAVVSGPSADKASVRARCEGFGNYMPPPEVEEAPTGVAGLVNEMVGFVGDAVADTVDDFREKGAVGAVRDGIADAADLIMDSVSSVWGLLGGRKVREAQAAEVANRGAAERICQPRAPGSCPAFKYCPPQEEPFVPVDNATVEAPVEPEPLEPVSPADLLSFEDAPSPRTGADLLDLDEPMERRPALKLKQEGNDLVRSKKFQEAVKCYEAAIAALDIEGGEKVLLSSLHANLALCYLNLELYRRAQDAATQSLDLDPWNTKAQADLEDLLSRSSLTAAELRRLRQGLPEV